MGVMPPGYSGLGYFRNGDFQGIMSTPTRTTLPSTSISTFRRSQASHVRAQRREVLRTGHPHPLLGREPGQLGARRGGVRRGMDQVLPRVPEPRAPGDALVARGLPEVLPSAL